jgi:hypothetical protein
LQSGFGAQTPRWRTLMAATGSNEKKFHAIAPYDIDGESRGEQ